MIRTHLRWLTHSFVSLAALGQAAAAAAQAADTPVEQVSPVYTALFLLLFIGGTVGVGWYMWWSDRREKRSKDEKPAGGGGAR